MKLVNCFCVLVFALALPNLCIADSWVSVPGYHGQVKINKDTLMIKKHVVVAHVNDSQYSETIERWDCKNKTISVLSSSIALVVPKGDFMTTDSSDVPLTPGSFSWNVTKKGCQMAGVKFN